MNKFKVGQRVKIKATGNIEEILDVDSVDISPNGFSNQCYCIKSRGYCFHYTVHDLEEVKDILDPEEKEYLGNIIKPFKSRVTSIAKRYANHCGSKGQYIEIKIKNIRYTFSKDLIHLSEFKQKTMYKNMKINKQYTLKELGL